MRRMSLIAVGLAVVPHLLAAQRPDSTANVGGVVFDVHTGQPIVGARIALPDIDRRVTTDEMGRFVLFDIPQGEQLWVIERLGYVTWKEPVRVEHLDQLTIGLVPKPVELDEITVKVDRLKRRRRAAGVSMRVIDRDEIVASAASNAAQLVTRRGTFFVVPCRGLARSAFTTRCIYSRGRTVVPRVCIDERRAFGGFDDLAAYRPEEIHAIEYYAGGRVIRVYTTWFMESGQAIVSPWHHC